MPEGQVLEFTNVTKRFGDVTALSDFSARIAPGAVTGLLGPNGAGKTTSLRILLGQVRATSGTATIGGVPYFDMRQPLRTIGSVLEDTAYRPRRTAARQLQIAAKANGIPVERVGEVLDLVGLHGDADTRIGTFSLGMRQRLSLATALLGDPGVLVLDEPANGLDPEGIRWMRLLMRRLADEGRTVLVSSHVLSEVEQVADDVVVLSKGRAVYTGGIDSLSDPTTGAVIVDAEDRAPLTAALAAAGLEFDVLRSGVTVRGSDAAAIGALAASAGVALTVLQQRGPSLEEVFLDLVYGRRTEPVSPNDAAGSAAEAVEAVAAVEAEDAAETDAFPDGAAESAEPRSDEFGAALAAAPAFGVPGETAVAAAGAAAAVVAGEDGDADVADGEPAAAEAAEHETAGAEATETAGQDEIAGADAQGDDVGTAEQGEEAGAAEQGEAADESAGAENDGEQTQVADEHQDAERVSDDAAFGASGVAAVAAAGAAAAVAGADADAAQDVPAEDGAAEAEAAAPESAGDTAQAEHDAEAADRTADAERHDDEPASDDAVEDSAAAHTDIDGQHDDAESSLDEAFGAPGVATVAAAAVARADTDGDAEDEAAEGEAAGDSAQAAETADEEAQDADVATADLDDENQGAESITEDADRSADAESVGEQSPADDEHRDGEPATDEAATDEATTDEATQDTDQTADEHHDGEPVTAEAAQDADQLADAASVGEQSPADDEQHDAAPAADEGTDIPQVEVDETTGPSGSDHDDDEHDDAEPAIDESEQNAEDVDEQVRGDEAAAAAGFGQDADSPEDAAGQDVPSDHADAEQPAENADDQASDSGDGQGDDAAADIAFELPEGLAGDAAEPAVAADPYGFEDADETDPAASRPSPISHVPLPFATSAISLPGATVEPTFTELITGLPATGAVDEDHEEEDDAVDDVPVEAHEVFAPLLSRDIDDAPDGGAPADSAAEGGETDEDDDPRLSSMRDSLAAARRAYFEDPAPAWPYGKAPESDADADGSESESESESDEDTDKKD